jgi:hypothetical protein
MVGDTAEAMACEREMACGVASRWVRRWCWRCPGGWSMARLWEE